MTSSESKADASSEPGVDEQRDVEENEPLELTPDEILEMNSSAEEAFSPE